MLEYAENPQEVLSMIKQRKKYKRPRRLFETARIAEENTTLKQYGLKNKKEIWRAETSIDSIRNQAKKLIVASEHEQKKFIEKLSKMGLVKEGSRIDDVLGLKKENLLDRRLQTVVFKQGLAKTAKQARQIITHKNVIVAGHIINIPSYLVSEKTEKQISLKIKQRKEKPAVIPAVAEEKQEISEQKNESAAKEVSAQ